MPPMKRNTGAAVRKWDGRPFRVLAFDPGGTTGWAYCKYTEADGFEHQSGQWGPDTHHQLVWTNLNSVLALGPPNLEVVCESFEYRNRSRAGLELVSKEYIGVINLFCEMFGTPLTFHTASAAKHLITDEKIKVLGLWVPGNPHAMDATRHLLRHLVIGKGIREPITDKWLEM